MDAYYHAVVLPTKRRLDAEYMARATFFSDLRLLVNSVLRRWDASALDEFIIAAAFEVDRSAIPSQSARFIERYFTCACAGQVESPGRGRARLGGLIIVDCK